ncbi:hypothetical protein FE773_06540 [Caminibacter mediatlanticus TB-2]|uniref:YcaO domain-containing protein n=1 Tax=Caminibacter mediatlanticus TB-2 TaxID=391592 RepID=A0ABX5VBM9_9BACT|nr:YcaO-like family protein [Caminibacter mediatlanticus]QCT94852.1 hypothetical protein FE773_06540 [Caminibacter mediatlanticus TB-2]
MKSIIECNLNYKNFLDATLCECKAKNLPFKSFGKGFNQNEAKISAIGEMNERILTRNYFEEYYVDSLYPDAIITDKFLNSKLYEFYNIKNLEKEDLFDFNSDIFDILSIPFIHKQSGKYIYFPINLIHNIYASNGMAFHTNLKDAYYNAKSEIIERFVKFQVIKYGLPLPKIAHPYNSEKIQIYDATLDGKYPVMAASFIENDEVILSFGCDLDKNKAINKAYLELLQTEFKERGRFLDDIDYIKEPVNLTQHFINLSGDIHSNFLKKPYFDKANWNFETLNVFNKDEYFRIYRYKNFIAIQVIIPEISEVYPIDDLKYYNINKGKFIRNDILNLKNKQKVLNYLYENAVWDIGEFIGVIFNKKYTIEEVDKLYDGYEFDEKYKNILSLSKELNEI